MRISIITPVFNQWVYTKNYLNSFANLPDDSEIIIIDNNSTDQTKEEIKKYLKPNVKVITNDTNTGFGYASNQGYQQALGEVVIFLNNDIKIQDKSLKWLDKLYNEVSQCNDMLFSPTGGYVDPKKDFEFAYEVDYPNETNKQLNYLSGWFLCSKKTTFDKLIEEGNIGPFNSLLYFAYFEDTHLGLLSSQLNITFQLIKVPLVHIGKQTSKTLNISKLYQESRKKFIKRWKH